jgi:CRP-like cAMP-binding protein
MTARRDFLKTAGALVVAFSPTGHAAAQALASGDGALGKTVDGTEVATLGAGSYFGEMALIDGGSRTATITAFQPVSSLSLAPSAFLRTVDREPMLARGIFTALSERLRAMGDQVDGDASAVDRARLIELCERLRAHSEHPEWAPATSPVKRRLVLTNLFARGS